MKKNESRFLSLTAVLYPLLFGVLLIALWQGQILHKLLNTTTLILPLPTRILSVISDNLPAIAADTWATVSVILPGLVLGSIIGYLLAVFATNSPRFGATGLTIIAAISAVPTVALAAVILQWTRDVSTDVSVRSYVMTGEGLGSDVGQNPELVAKYTKAVKSGTHLPVLAKMTPNIGNMEIPAVAAVEAGADGLAAINTIKSILSVDSETLIPSMDVKGKNAVSGYSGKAVKPIALRFINDMAQCKKLYGTPISGMGGIETWSDALDFISLGCSNIQITTAVMEYGYRIIDDLIDGLKRYMGQKGITSVNDLVGKALGFVVAPDNLSRDTIVYPKFDLTKCIGCGRCTISCKDAGHSALIIKNDKPVMQAGKCVGCQLCRLVCPTGAISSSERMAKNKRR